MTYTGVFATSVAVVAMLLLAEGGCGEKKTVFQCVDELGCVTVAPDEPLKIGVLQALTGKVASLGRDQVRGMDLALEDVDGRIMGHAVELQLEDTGCTAEGGANAVLKIIADPHKAAIFGTTCSGAARTASQAMSRAGLLMISGNNSAPFLTSMNNEKAPYWQDGYFRVSNNDEHAGRAAAMYAFHELRVRKAAVIHDGDIYTRGLAEGFAKAFTQLGGEVTLVPAIEKGEKMMGPALTAVEQARAEFLFFPVFQPEGNYIVHHAKKRPGMEHVILMGAGAMIEQSFIDDVKDLGVGMFFVGPSRATGPRVDGLDRRYKLKYKEASTTGYYLYGYDASRMLFDALEKAAVIEENGTLHIGRRALRQAMYTMDNVKAVTGTLSCDEFGDCSKPKFTVLRLDDPGKGLQGLQANKMKQYVFD